MSRHAIFAPSAAHRWTQCPASALLCHRAPDLPPSPYAQEGTVAHALAAEVLGGDAMIDEDRASVTDEMRSHVQVYVDHCDSIAWCAQHRAVERHLVLVPHLLSGTPDFVCVDECDVLHVVDLKYGKGLRVDAEDNLQLQIYALAAMRSLPLELRDEIKAIELTIVQPRLSTEPSVWRIDYPHTWAKRFDTVLDAAIGAALDRHPPAVAGDHCRWCDALATGMCDQPHRGLLTAVHEGDDDDTIPLDQRLDRVARSAPLEQLSNVLRYETAIDEFFTSAKMRIKSRLEDGGEVDGWKLVRATTRRRWRADDRTVADRLVESGADEAAVWRSSIVSPAQAEKIVDRELVAELAEKPEGEIVLARETDRRPAIAVTPQLSAVTTDDERTAK